ncbi:hypothetical protein BTVI_53109 [Pitangus sulphuratus]|nr:hypothetical protein BTVI_53109 [Pitangus sulphuratus]
MTINQLKEHSLREHGKALTLSRPHVVSFSLSLGYCTSKKHTSAEEVEDSNDSSYSEPPDVQQQLNHYQSAALSRNNNISQIPLSGGATGMEKTEAILNCEFCEFSSGYIQSIRRHYRDKHGGKRLFKCKDCSFYTGFKSAFTMHVEAGHSADPEEGPKDLHCPLCLYHTKYKRNMIDHIVLHREERVVPIEVCRSKLSKYLQGVVFCCDKCTFTCSTDESLQQHIEKHNELKPYKCQLCYYETKYTEELDTHLRDEHKVPLYNMYEALESEDQGNEEVDEGHLKEKEVDEAFYRQLEAASQSQALVPVGDFNQPDICWRSNTAMHKQSRRFLESIDDNFLTQPDINASTFPATCKQTSCYDRLRPIGNMQEMEPGSGHLNEYREVVRVSKNEMRKAKAHLDLNLAKDVKDNKKGFFKYISNKRKSKDNVSPLLNGGETPVTEDAEKSELLNTTFALVCTDKTSPQESLTQDTRVKECWKEDFPLVKEDWVRELGKLDIHKFMGPDGMHP